MDNAKNGNLVVLEKVHDAVIPEGHFAEVFAVELGNDTADAGILEECLCGCDDAIDEGNGVKNGIAGDEVFDVLKIVPGGQRPADLRHRAILSFNSS